MGESYYMKTKVAEDKKNVEAMKHKAGVTKVKLEELADAAHEAMVNIPQESLAWRT